MIVSATRLRQDIYRILDEALRTGEVVEVDRGGRRLRIVPVAESCRSRLDRLTSRLEVVNGDPEDLVHLDWSADWQP